MPEFLTDYLNEIAEAFLNPQKRVFVGYLALALAIAAAACLISSRGQIGDGLAKLRQRLLSPAIWWSASARADYKIFAINQALMLGVAPRLLSQLTLATLLFEWLHGQFGAPPGFGGVVPFWLPIAVFTISQFLLDDLSRYLLHRLLHRVPLLWTFHKVHHSAETMTPMTVFRTHPVEAVLFALRATMVQGTVIAVCVFLFGEHVDLATVLGANLFMFLFNATGANLRHSHIHISYGRGLERVLLSPAQHQVHHSHAPEHFDRNFGSVLAIWDLVGGTLHPAATEGSVRFGLAGTPTTNAHSLKQLYLEPLAEFARTMANNRHAITTGVQFVTMIVTRALRLRSAVAVMLLAALAATVSGSGRAADAQKPLDIYSHRQPFLIEPFIKAYQKQTGVEVNIVYASKGLVQRLLAEGKRSPADLVLTVDIARLAVYADQDLLAPVQSTVLERNIPAHLRAPDGRWFALSKRARVVAASKERVANGEIERIEDLADPRWKDRICSRPGSHVYNRALLGSMIAAHGEDEARAWARGLVNNLARRPQGNDRAQLKAIFQGECDVAIINHYYWAKLQHDGTPEQKQWADAVNVVFTNQNDRGNHINISGGGVAIHSDNKEGAIRFLEFLSKPEAQQLYGTVNFEFPVNPAVPVAGHLHELGAFKEDDLPITRLAELAPLAQRIVDEVGW